MKYINTNKLEKLKINNDNVYFVIDFDRTITSKESEDSWSVSGRLLGEDFKKEIDELYIKYRPIEMDYQITIEEKEKAMIEWYSKCMYLYYKYHLTEEKLKKSVREGNLIFRFGAKEFFKTANENNIPIIILSAGIGNVIEEFLKLNDCYYDNIYIISNFMEFDKNGDVKEFDNSNMIHTMNKTMKEKLPQYFLEKLVNRTYKVLIGDLKEDEKMVEKDEWDTTLKIGILENETEERLKTYNEAFDIVLTEEDAAFEIVEKFLNDN